MKTFLISLMFAALVLGHLWETQAQDDEDAAIITAENALELTLLAELPHVGMLEWSPDGTTLAINADALYLYDVRDFALAPKVINGDFWRIAYWADGTLMGLQRRDASNTDDSVPKPQNRGGVFNLINIHNGKHVTTIHIETGYISSAAFSPDATLLAVGTEEDTILVWDLVHGELLGILNGHEVPPTTLAFSHDNRFIASGAGTGDHLVFLWDVASLSPLRVLSHDPDQDITAEVVAFSPDDRWLITGETHGIPLLQWNMETLLNEADVDRKTLMSGLIAVLDIAFSPSSSIMAVIMNYPIAISEDVVRLLNPANGASVAEWTVPDGADAISFSADGAFIAILQRESGTIQIWGVRSVT